MKVLFAVTSLLAVVAVLASSRGDRRYRFNEVDERDVEPFRAGQTIKYRFDTQISSGMASVSDQHAVTRLQAEALLHFQTDRLVSLKLNDVVVGTLNHEIQQPEKVQPMQMFQESQIKSEEQRQLELPLTFDYEDGLVERIRFHQQDQPWSKNIKKSLLNMLQSNLKQRKQEGLQLEQQPEWQQEKELNLYSNNQNEQVSQMFVMPEITLEGECQVAYTINKVNSQNKFNANYDNDNELSSSSSSDLKVFNVTKSVDFHRCQKIADIRFGSKIKKPCQNCTSQQELEERRLDRTTIVRQVVVGTPEKYGIKKAEVVSHYVFKMLNAEQDAPMHTIVAGQLTYVRMEESRQEVERELKQASKNGKEETLLYNTEWDEKEKLFYMFGDEEFPQGGPFEKVQDKVNKAENLMKKAVGMWSDKQKGIESEATITYSRLVEALRMCSQDELNEIYQRIASNERFNEQEKHKAQDILIDALANAGTLNTIQVLTEKVLKNKIQPARATRAIFQLKDVPAPSGKQVEILANLCENEICDRHGPCRQVCWLTVGTLMGELCSEHTTVQDSVDQKKPQCHQELKKKFWTKAMNQYEKLETRYEKIVLLKAVGNAGCDMSVQQLEKIIHNIREDPIVRMQAIDSLRRLRAVMPQKIQRVLLPVFQNVRERPEVRMQALSQILATFPENPILDQIGYTLLKEPSRQVKSFVYMAMKQLSQSPVEVEQELAKHLKALLKLANITEEDEETLLSGSRLYRVPIYSQAKKEGFFAELESIVGADNILPKQLSAGLDTLFNGLFQKNSLELTATQEDLEQWAEKIMDLIMEYQFGSKKNSGNSRASRYSSRRQVSTENDNDFKKMIQELSIKRRSRVDSDADRQGSNSPYAMLSFRYGDIDYAILPLEEEILPQAFKRVFVQGQQPSISDFEDLLDTIKGRPFRVQAALNLLENSVKIPTSAGLPIRVWHVLPVLASIEGSVKPQWKSGQMSAEVKLHPTISATHFKRVEVQSPMVNSGVETTRTAGINIPLTSEVQIRSGEQQPTFKWTVNVPQKQFRAVNLHTLPATYTTETEWTQIRTPVVKRIENQQLLARAQHVEKIFGQQSFGMPLKVQGEVHFPHQMNYEQIIRVLTTTENHMQVFFQPTEETPNQIIMTAQGEFFQQAESNRDHQSFKNFHSSSRFDDEMDQHYEQFGSDARQFDRFVDSFAPSKTLKHFAKIQIETRGGRQDKQAQAQIQAQHDSQLRHIKVQLKAQRSPLPVYFDEENKDWTMNAQIQAMLPEVHSSMKQYQENRGQKQQKFVAKIQSEWGSSSRMQQINININGEQARNPEWRQKLQEIERLNTPDAKQLKQQMIQKVAFINKFDIAADFENLTPATKNFFNTLATVLKSWNFWQTSTEWKQARDQQARSGELKATVVIDPMTHEHLNVTIKTPVEIVRINSLALPIKAKPFKLVKPGQMSQKSVDSWSNLVSDFTTETGRQECKVDSRKVRSFDDVIFKAPITKCYTVLAKDCSNPESPRFAVMMKKINGQDKKLKVKLQGDVIEVQPKNDELIVKINGQQETNEDTLEEFGIQAQQDLVRIANRDITVTFDGQQATIKLSPKHKQAQCGLCGHYDDDTEDEFRTADNELTEDLKTYHKSYTLQEQECREDFEQTHRQEEFKRLHNQRQQHRQQQRRESEWDWESSEDREQYEQESRRRQQRNDNDETEPIEKTEVMEYNHKICFSVKPVKTCPEESYPSKTKEMKVGFMCMDRSSPEARQLLRQARRSNQPLDLPKNKPSFVESLTMPSSCTVY